METPSDVWDDITDVLNPVTVAEGEIESVRVSICNGGVRAKTAEPIPTPDYGSDIGDFDPEKDDAQEHIEEFREQRRELSEEDMPENEELLLYDELGLYLKDLIMGSVEEAVVDTPTLSSLSVTRCTITEDKISPIVTISNQVRGDEQVKSELAEVLANCDIIESSDKLAYGVVDSVYELDSGYDSGDGWKFDGTLYKYTDEPYSYWSEGSDSDYPDNMSEWAEFASDTEGRKQHILSRDTHVVHFHPMKTGLSDDHALIQWFDDVRSKAFSECKFEDSVIQRKYLNSVEVDELGYATTIQIVL